MFAKVIPDAGSVLNTNSPSTVSTPVEVGNATPAPEIEAKKVTGETFQLKDLRGRVVVLNFWATWCVPCREEIPELISMQHDLDARGLSVVGAVWNDPATTDDIKAYQKEGVPIWGITIQNEPMATQRWESCIYSAEEERDFLKNFLG